MTAALILAMGKTAHPEALDPLRPVGGITALKRLILLFQQAGISRIVVAGPEDAALERHAAHMGAVFLRSSGEEMLDGVKDGLRYLEGICERALITPVDVPLFLAETARRLCALEAPAAVPTVEGRKGHPLLLSASLFPLVLGYSGEGGLAGALRTAGIMPRLLEVEDEGVLMDVQRTEDFAHLVQAHSVGAIRPGVKLYFQREKPFFGPGPCLLLSLLRENASMKQACARMGISYSKGWQIIDRAEAELGYALVERQRGGREKGSSSLTPRGEALLDFYQALEERCRAFVEREFITSGFFGEPS